MDNKATDESVELDERGMPLVKAFDEFASRHLLNALIVLFYVAPLALGLNYGDILSYSPLVYYAAYVIGFLTSVTAGVPAFLIAGGVLGQWSFAKEVFSLYENNDFSIAMSLIFLVMLIVMFLTRIIDRTVSSYQYRKVIFCFAIVFIISSFVPVFTYINGLDNKDIYIYSFSIIGIAYFVLFKWHVHAGRAFIVQQHRHQRQQRHQRV